MDALRTFGIAAALLVAAPAAADPMERWHSEIAEASARFGVPAAWIIRVLRAETGGRTTLNGRPVTSRAGAMGLMQLMPATWAAMRAAHRLGHDPHDPRDNILAGTAWLRAMYDRFGYPGLFAAYNAGPGRYTAHLRSGRALPAETRAYLAQVTGAAPLPPSQPDRAAPTLFVTLRGSGHGDGGTSPPSAADGPPDPLFALRPQR